MLYSLSQIASWRGDAAQAVDRVLAMGSRCCARRFDEAETDGRHVVGQQIDQTSVGLQFVVKSTQYTVMLPCRLVSQMIGPV